MVIRSENKIGLLILKTTITLNVVFFFVLAAGPVAAQRRFARSYPAGQSVKIELLNRTGTVTVEGWNRPEINITADLESPAPRIEPHNLSGKIVINVLRDNQGRGDVGDANFTIRVPFNAEVDIETRIGNLRVSNVRSARVRAHISAEGDITLTNITALAVSAENTLGDIFFDGEIVNHGIYRFTSMKGTISVRIPFNSNFKVVATAPSTRYIQLGVCQGGMTPFGDGRRVIGKCGDGSASLVVTNQRGNIAFYPR
jgi:hypothetical protein